MKSNRGVTIVELVMVIVVTMILAGASIAGLNGVQAWRSAAAVKRLHADFGFVRNLAMLSTRRTALVVVDQASMTYELRQEAAPGAGTLVTTPLTHPVTGQDWRVVWGSVATGLSLLSNSGPAGGVIGFDADGLPIDASGTLWNADIDLSLSSGATIAIEQQTGIAELTWP